MGQFRKFNFAEIQQTISLSSPSSGVYVGCDSKLSGAYTIFGLVLVIHIDSHHGGMVFGEKKIVEHRLAMSERLMREVDYAMDCAFQITDAVDNRNFEVHLDINPNPTYKSNKVMKQAVAYVKAQGFNYKIKPGAWAASTAADYLIS